MVLKSLRLVNFKSHIDSTIEFDQLTSIIGSNNAGKTNIVRALKLVLHHGDWPISWIRHGQSSSTIELELQSGVKVTRKRTKTSQSVSITEPSGKVTTFTGKKDAQEFIEKAIGIKRIVLDEQSGPEDLNFIDVYDPPYLIGARSDTVQRKISGIIGANTIEDARVRLTKKARKVNEDLLAIDNQLKTLRESLNKSGLLKTINNSLQTVKELQEKGNERQSVLQKLNNISNELHIISSYITILNVAPNVTGLRQEIKDLIEACRNLEVTIQQASRICYSFQNNKIHDLTIPLECKTLVSNLLKKYNEKASLLQVHSNLSNLPIIASEIKSLEESLNKALLERQAYVSGLEVCPVCFKPLNK